MSHISALKDLKQECAETGQCEAYQAYLQTELQKYDTYSRDSTIQIAGFGLVGFLIALAILLAAFYPSLKKLLAYVATGLIIILPIITLGVIAAVIGFLVSFGACFKEQCSVIESTAVFTIPVISLLISMPVSVKISKRKRAIRAKLTEGKSSIWKVTGVVLVSLVLFTTVSALVTQRTYYESQKQKLIGRDR